MPHPYLIYTGPGAEGKAFSRLSRLIKKCGRNSRCSEAKSPAELIRRIKDNRCTLLIMPGGRDLPYLRALRGEPNKLIRTFISQGGSYLGICAGAYYGAREVVFEKGGPLEVVGSRELCFFPGAAVGPAYGLGQFDYKKPAGARTASLQSAHGSISIYYNGGCFFRNAHCFPAHVDILASYNDVPESPAAVVACRVGRGRVILSGVHPEMEAEDLAHDTPRADHVRSELEEGKGARAGFFASWLDWLENR